VVHLLVHGTWPALLRRDNRKPVALARHVSLLSPQLRGRVATTASAYLLSVQRLAFSCEVLRERSDRGPRQLQRPSWTPPFDLSTTVLLPWWELRPVVRELGNDVGLEPRRLKELCKILLRKPGEEASVDYT
jgi:hypothetical protein